MFQNLDYLSITDRRIDFIFYLNINFMEYMYMRFKRLIIFHKEVYGLIKQYLRKERYLIFFINVPKNMDMIG